MAKYIYQYNNWPNFTWDESKIQALLGTIRHLQGTIYGKMSALGFSKKDEAMLTSLTKDVIKSSEIEGKILNQEQVRSSIARKLGITYQGMITSDRYIDGVVDMMLDVTQNYNNKIDENRLFSWHAALFPTGYSGMAKIDVAQYRSGEMQIVSGAMGKEKIHFEAPLHNNLKYEMDQFISWFNSETEVDLVIKAAITHFWFIIIHPFDDGNGRIARALSEIFLARSDNSSQRYYSLSSQILLEKKAYYSILQKTQHNGGNITEWLLWFLNCLHSALITTEKTLQNVLIKSDFWEVHIDTNINTRQRLMLNKLFDGFDGKLKSSKWAKIAKCSSDTALRDINDLINKGILEKENTGGRNTNYKLVQNISK